MSSQHPYGQTYSQPKQLSSGEPDAGKPARPVRRGADGKGSSRYLAGGLPYYEYEGIRVYLPSTVTEVIDMNRDFKYHYNYQRPNQALTCANQPPRLAFPHLPQRPALPQLVDPDDWLRTINGKLFKRRIDPGGRVKVDKHRYYIGQSYQGRYVVLRVEAEAKQFVVELANQPIKTLPIKGLPNQPMTLE